jgi:hypothetical protein
MAIAASLALLAATSLAGTPDLSSCNSWRPACTSNYTNSSRPSSYPINYVVIHKVQGSAAGAASWFENCSAQVTAHFIFDNSSGYCYQSVREADIAWHAGNWTYNTQSIGIEHGGYVSNNDTANICYRNSGLESRSAIIYYSVLWNRSRIVGHSEVPGATHTDPGIYWDWTFYMSCANNLVGGAIRDHWLDLGGSRHAVGNPTTGELTCPDGVGKYNHFNGAGGQASIYWTPSTGAHEVHGDIHAKWQALGWETGVCGYPTTDESTCPDGVGRYNHFSKGSSIYWTPSTGAHQVGGAIRNKWESLGWENSSLGYPTSDEYDISGGRRSNFQNGTITWNASTGVVTVP